MVSLLALILGIAGSLLISMSFHHALEREKDNARGNYQIVLNTLRVISDDQAEADYQSIALTLQLMSAQNVVVWSGLRLSTEDEIKYEEGAAVQYLHSEPSREKLKEGKMIYVGDPQGKQYLQVSGALLVGGMVTYLDMAYDISGIYEIRELQQSAYKKIFLIMVFLCLVLAYSISWVLTRPIARLSKASEAIAAGDLSYRARVCTKDEVGALTQEFNTMADKLEENMGNMAAAIEHQERFMGSFAHELKTPMTSIIGYSDLIRSQSLDEGQQATAANYIFSEAKRLENLSFKLLELLVLQKKDMPLLEGSPGQVAEKVTESLRSMYEKDGIFIRHCCEEGTCLMESDLVSSLLFNLLDNARKALEHGGEILVTVEMTVEGCRICVSDNGRGISQKALQHLTEAFYREDKSRTRRQGGAGLGLALCREIAALHGGNLSFESALGKGTAVTVELRGGRVK